MKKCLRHSRRLERKSNQVSWLAVLTTRVRRRMTAWRLYFEFHSLSLCLVVEHSRGKSRPAFSRRDVCTFCASGITMAGDKFLFRGH